MDVKRKSTYTLKVSSDEMAALLQLVYAAKDFTHGVCRGEARIDDLAEAIKNVDPFVLDHVYDVLGNFGVELGVD